MTTTLQHVLSPPWVVQEDRPENETISNEEERVNEAPRPAHNLRDFLLDRDLLASQTKLSLADFFYSLKYEHDYSSADWELDDYLISKNSAQTASALERDRLLKNVTFLIPQVSRLAIENHIDLMLALGQQETLEEGIESVFSRRLLDIIDRFGVPAVEILESKLRNMRANTNLVVEAMSTIGSSMNTQSRSRRLELLCSFLSDPSPRIRYGAMIGLSTLGDESALNKIKRARSAETVKILQGVLDQLIEYLTPEQS